MVILFGLNLVFGYLAMLVAMTYSIELFICVVLGLCVGHFTFNTQNVVGKLSFFISFVKSVRVKNISTYIDLTKFPIHLKIFAWIHFKRIFFRKKKVMRNTLVSRNFWSDAVSGFTNFPPSPKNYMNQFHEIFFPKKKKMLNLISRIFFPVLPFSNSVIMNVLISRNFYHKPQYIGTIP